MNLNDIPLMIKGYVDCALWTATNELGEPLDAVYSVEHISRDSLDEMRTDCTEFCYANKKDITNSKLSPEQIGHDFWLTRNGHGTGFWDRGLGEIGKRLAQNAKIYGPSDPIISDDDQLEVI